MYTAVILQILPKETSGHLIYSGSHILGYKEQYSGISSLLDTETKLMQTDGDLKYPQMGT